MALVAVLACGLAMCSSAAAATYTVNDLVDLPPTAEKTEECNGAPSDCSLAQALNRAEHGDTVIVPASPLPYLIGTLKPLPVPGGVTIAGAGAGATVISGGGVDQAFELEGPAPTTIANLTITDTFNGSGEPEGGAINGEAKLGDELTLEGVVISHSSNTLANSFGGAVEIGSPLTVRNSRFIEDSAVEGGGAIDVFHSTTAVPLTITGSAFENDSAGSGGGGAVVVERGNSLSVTSSTFAGNTAEGGPGGAIQLYPEGPATIQNSTFFGNSAERGGAIADENAVLRLLNDTLDDNGAAVGANLDVMPGPASDDTVENTIFAKPYAEGTEATSCAGKVISEGDNLEDQAPTSCGLSQASDRVGVDPLLAGELSANWSLAATAGGPAPTVALEAGSPAIGAGNPSGCAEVGALDERGFPRPGIGSACDIGAYELLASIPTSTTLASSAASSQLGSPVTLSVSVSVGEMLPATVPVPTGTVEFRDGATLLGSVPLSAEGASLTTTSLPPGEHAFSAVYSGDGLHAGSTSGVLTDRVIVATSGSLPAPAVNALAESHRRWREGSGLARLTRGPRAPVGTTFSWTLNTPADVVFTFLRAELGRSVGGRCVAATKRNKRRRRCRRAVSVGSLRSPVGEGVGDLHFAGRLSSTRRLPPGNYTVVVTATNTMGRATPRRLGFTILAS